MRSLLDGGGDTGATGLVLSGLGGVGKTQLAAEYARTVFGSPEVDLLVWVNAADRGAVVDTYAARGGVVRGRQT
ncbi:hypothetical protein B1R27_13215 [Streptomyces sp. GKU 895]|nr:hypothetical protein B1R27_13215 [Streptomyces sp. GKU 895]